MDALKHQLSGPDLDADSIAKAIVRFTGSRPLTVEIEKPGSDISVTLILFCALACSTASQSPHQDPVNNWTYSGLPCVSGLHISNMCNTTTSNPRKARITSIYAGQSQTKTA